MLNNKGQSLVMFVLLIPIFLLIMIMVVDIGKMILLKQELNNINYMAIDYGLDKINEEDIEISISEIIKKNKSDIDNIDISIVDNKLYIELEDSVNNTMKLFDNVDLFYVKSYYVGYIENDKRIIKEGSK